MHNGLSRASVVGLGKLGVPLAACLAARGFRVIGVDVDRRRVAAINSGQSSVFEPGLGDFVAAAKERLSATESAEAAESASDTTFIVVPTPCEPDGGFSLRYVLAACEAIGRALRGKEDFHLVILSSTVMPGSTDGPVRSTLEAISGKRCGLDFGLCYSPEFVALGSVINDLLNPDFVLIGQSDDHSGALLEMLYREMCENNPPIVRMNFVNAELTKLAVNTFVTTKITFANMLARICEQLPGANVDVITSALGLDRRIGSKYLKGAIGYGGPCFPRDNGALAAVAGRVGAPAILAEATDRANRGEVLRLAALIKSKLPTEGTVGIMGLAYKPHTDVVDESQGLLLARELMSQYISVIAYDPVAMTNASCQLGSSIRFADSLEGCVEAADVIVITTPWDVFLRLTPELLERRNKPRVLIDCWRILDKEKFESVVEYVPLGLGQKTEACP